MKILGLDLSSKPGYALMEEGRLINHGTLFNLKSKLTPSPAAVHLPDYALQDLAWLVASNIRGLLLDNQPDLIFIEQSNQGSGMSSMKGQEFIHFAVLDAIRKLSCDLKTHYVYSSSWRSACGIKMTKEQRAHNKLVKTKQARGKIRSKHLAVQWANEKFGLSLLMKDEDAADAIGIAYGGHEIWKRKGTTPDQKVSIDQAFT